jgi:hypothetical protein
MEATWKYTVEGIVAKGPSWSVVVEVSTERERLEIHLHHPPIAPQASVEIYDLESVW